VSGLARLASRLLLACALVLPLSAGAAHLNAIRIDGSINPASADFLIQAIALSEEDGAVLLIVELDTPGGLLVATKDIVQALLNARVPVVVFVAPRGAWAASAGAFVTLASHVAVMAPGTSIGAASPVGATGEGGTRGEDDERQDVGAEKAEKFTTAFIESIAEERGRNVEWARQAVREAEAISADKALELGVIDLIAKDREDLLGQLQGREVKVDGGLVVLDLEGAAVREIEMNLLTRFFHFLASPNVAYLLFMAGLLGLYVEYNQPGLLVPGIAGAICLLLAGIAFQILPFSWAGLLLMLLGLAFIVAEVFVTSFGALFVLGMGCLLIGGSMLFDVPEVTGLSVSFWNVLVPVVAGFGLFAALVIFAVGRTLASAQTAGVFELIGLVGRASTPLAPDGKVFVRGEYWSAVSDEEIAAGMPVEVTAVEGMRLRVRRVADRR
jgi:membrane-bound serine protease (ClpP class)